MLGASKLGLFDDPLAYPGFEHDIYKSWVQVAFPSRTQNLKKTFFNQKRKILPMLKAKNKYFCKIYQKIQYPEDRLEGRDFLDIFIHKLCDGC